MPTYQRTLLNGVPVWKDSDGLYYYYETQAPPTETTRIPIGSEATGLNPDWKLLLEPHLNRYRQTIQARSRALKK